MLTLRSETNRSAGPRHWFAGQAAMWIAYGTSPVPITQPHPVWGYNPPKILRDALAARAIGKVWHPSEPLPYGEPYHYRARAKRIMREMGLSAAEALQSLLDAESLEADQNRRISEALHVLNRAVEAGNIIAEGRPTTSTHEPTDHKPYEPIPTHLIDGLRAIDASGWLRMHSDLPGWEWIHDNGPFYHGVRFEEEQIKALWPAVSASDTKPEILEWLTNAATAFLCNSGGKAKRDVLVRECVAKLKCRYEDAEAAYMLLPTHLRRRRGEHG